MSNCAKFTFAMAVPMVLGLVACKSEERRTVSQSEPSNLAELPANAAAFPTSLPVIGEGFPDKGDACRQLGETDITTEWMDDRAILVGCPTRMDARQLGGKLVGVIDGITILSVDTSAPAIKMISPVGQNIADGGARVAGTAYHSSAKVPCGFDGEPARESCAAGVKRHWGSDGTTLVEVSKPDGRKRAIYFRGVKAFGANGAKVDGSAAYDFTATRKGDESLISFGPERYVVPDALIGGG